MKSNNQNDNQNNYQLWLQFKNGNRQAFAELYQIHITSLIAYGSKLCDSEEVLKDNIQDLFIELWNSKENLADVDCVKFYLFKALRNKLLRSEKKRQLQSPLSVVYSDSFQSPVETEIINKETRESQINILRKAVNTLTKRQQEIIQLRFYLGFSNEQIAELMSMNYQSVSNLMYSALCRIKKNLTTSVFTTTLTALATAVHLFF
jgi:RNA polymerase sigma factor (sigma-70 family)